MVDNVSLLASTTCVYYMTFIYTNNRLKVVKLLKEMSNFENFGKPPNFEQKERRCTTVWLIKIPRKRRMRKEKQERKFEWKLWSFQFNLDAFQHKKSIYLLFSSCVYSSLRRVINETQHANNISWVWDGRTFDFENQAAESNDSRNTRQYKIRNCAKYVHKLRYLSRRYNQVLCLINNILH